MIWQSHSVNETEAIAAGVAGDLRPGDVVALHGEMGAGKTHFVRGLVRGLSGNVRAVCSPTFVLLNIYPTPTLTVYHLDAYRVGGSEDFEAIGFTELLEQGGVVIVEWPERVGELIPAAHVDIRLEVTSPTRRTIRLERICNSASPG